MSAADDLATYWIPKVGDPEAPTAAELAAGVPPGEVVDDGLQFTRDDSVDLRDLFPQTSSYKVIHHPDGSMDVIPQDACSIELVSEPDWIVFRPAADLPPDALPPDMDGWWLDRRGLPASGTLIHQSGFVARFAPTGRFEVRDGGAVAEVYEVRP